MKNGFQMLGLPAKSIFTLTSILMIQCSTYGGELRFTESTTPVQAILRAEAKDANLILVTSVSRFEIPLMNSAVAEFWVDKVKFYDQSFECTLVAGRNICEEFFVDWAKRKINLHVERTKIFPNYYREIESECRRKSESMLYGKLSWYGVEIFQMGRLVMNKVVGPFEVHFLNNTNPMELGSWMKIDRQRNRVVLLNGMNCQTVGEVSL